MQIFHRPQRNINGYVLGKKAISRKTNLIKPQYIYKKFRNIGGCSEVQNLLKIGVYIQIRCNCRRPRVGMVRAAGAVCI